MSKFTENMKNWGISHPKTVRFGKAFATMLAKGLAESTIGQLNAPAVVDAVILRCWVRTRSNSWLK